ncbi:MAG: LysR family transcriptional regulator [Rhizobiaceae bacterium]|jgi:DNA-binding transcriptional LysR family regulator|nr:LysR family transcriptional regulator [Rhizobiaceae bacterium]
MHTKALKTLIRIADVGSFATAANQLGITLPALSMQMKTLEQDLGTSLFDRSFRPPKLTPVGRRIARQAAAVIAAENTLYEIANPQEALSGTYRLGFVATASVRLLPLFLENASTLAPNVHFEFETGLSETLEDKLLSGQLEAAIVTATGDPTPGINHAVLRREELVYAIPSGYAEMPLGDLVKKLPFLQFNPGSGIGKLIASHISRQGSQRKHTIHLDSVEAIMECVNQGLGFTMLAQPDIERYSKNRLHILKPGTKGIFRQLVLATSERGVAKAARQKLCELFKG